MSRLNYLVRDLISIVGFPWRMTATLVRGRVFTMLYRYMYMQIQIQVHLILSFVLFIEFVYSI